VQSDNGSPHGAIVTKNSLFVMSSIYGSTHGAIVT